MRRIALIILALIGLFAILGTGAYAQTSAFDSLKARWTNKEYAQVIKPLVQLRATAPADQLLTIDYMIATSHCRLPNANQRAQGRAAFDAMLLYHYRNLNTAQQKQLSDERAKCGSDKPANATPARYVVLASRRGPARATYNFGGGKQYYNICGASSTGRRGEIMTERSLDGTRSQPVWTRAQLDSARVHVERMLRGELNSQGKVRARDGILVASMSTHTNAQLDTIVDAMVRYRDFYAREYGFPIPDTVVQVFLAQSGEQMVRLAKALHGLDLDRRLIGYSSLSDFTMIGIIPRTIYGTLMHELMHLIFRNQAPNSPPWLDEGLAALYEVSRFRGDRVVGIPNWRGQIIARSYYPTPLEQILGQGWNAFEGGDATYVEPDQQARNHALARYFVLYLQDKGTLPEVVRAVSARPVVDYVVSGDSVAVVTTDGTQMVALVAQIMGTTPAALQTDFYAWLQRVMKEGWTPC